jgi:hypothetical protein
MELSEQPLAVKYVVQFGLKFVTGATLLQLMETVVQGFGTNETLHFRTTTFWAQLLLGVRV